MKSFESKTLLVIGAPQHDAAAYHLCGFLAPDPVICARVRGRTYLAVSSLEHGRAEKQTKADELLSFEELKVNRLARELRSGGRGLAAAAAGLLKKLGAESSPVSVPPHLGIIYADELRARGLSITPDARLFADLRRSKTADEIAHVERTQRQVESACSLAKSILIESRPGEDGILVWRGEPLTSEVLRSEIDVELLRRGCIAAGTITAGGRQAADPHEPGRGPLREGEPIIVDIFPMDAGSRYYADMTRTFVKGDPSPEVKKMHEAVLESQEAALAMIRADINGRQVHEKVSEILHNYGYKTLVHDLKPGMPLREGFFHGTGHGVGLEIHEGPRLSITDEELREGDVVTVEPGVYDPRVGGVRIEDLVVVTADGCRNLTDFSKDFRV